MGLVCQVNHLMGFEAKGINDIFAHDLNTRRNVRHLFHVNFHMLLEASFDGEALTAVHTDIRIEIFVDLKVLVKIRYATKNLPALIALQAVGFVYDHTILRLNRQLTSMVRLHFDHVLTVCLKQYLSQQSLRPCGLDFSCCEAVHISRFHLNVIMV